MKKKITVMFVMMALVVLLVGNITSVYASDSDYIIMHPVSSDSRYDVYFPIAQNQIPKPTRKASDFEIDCENGLNDEWTSLTPQKMLYKLLEYPGFYDEILSVYDRVGDEFVKSFFLSSSPSKALTWCDNFQNYEQYVNYCSAKYPDSEPTSGSTVSGGTVSSDFSGFLSEGLTSVSNTLGTYVVKILPIGLAIMGILLAVLFAVRFFRSMSR